MGPTGNGFALWWWGCSLWVIKGLGQLSKALVLQCMVQAHGLHGPPVVTQETDINTDPSCGRTMAIGSRLDWISPWTRVAAYASQISMGPATTWSLDSSMAPGIGRDPEIGRDLGWQKKPQTSTQTLVAVGPWTQACS